MQMRSSAPCVVPVGLSRVGQHIEDKPCAKYRKFHGVNLAVSEAFLNNTIYTIHSLTP